MRRALTITTVALALLSVGSAASASWMVTNTVAAPAEAAGIVVDSGQRIWMTFRAPGVVPPAGYVWSYASLAEFRKAAPSIPPGSTVMYDLESWRFSPIPERHDPFRSMRRFASTAHAYGLKMGLCPSMRFLPEGAFHTDAALRVKADWFLIQLYIPGGTDLARQVHHIVRGFVGPVYFKLAAIPSHDLGYLLRQWRTVRRWTPNFVVWGGRAREPASVADAVEFLKRFT